MFQAVKQSASKQHARLISSNLLLYRALLCPVFFVIMNNMLSSHLQRTWAEIDLDKLKANFQTIRAITKQKICCVIKANAYGHGALRLARLYSELGADFLAVSNIEEAFELRNGGIELPILILGYSPAECAKALAVNNISQCLYSLDYARSLSAVAVRKGYTIKCHLKIDSGMGRIGFKDKAEAYAAACLPGLKIEGIFTHFASADEGDEGTDFTEGQFRCFQEFIDYLERHGISFAYKHCGNSAAILDYQEFGLDMVRAGIILYGYLPSAAVHNQLQLQPAMSFKSIITHIKEIEAGETVSYGRHFKAKKKTRIATVAVGYADGYLRANSSLSEVLINGQRAKITGNVCMDQLMVDVSNLAAKVGDEVILFNQELTADELAANCQTINYEIICAVARRVPRVYIRDGKVEAVNDYILD